MITFLVHSTNVTEVTDPESGAVLKLTYPGALDVTHDQDDVYMMNIHGQGVDEDQNPKFVAQPGDLILCGWDVGTGLISPAYPIQPEMEAIQPIGNILNVDTNTFDGTNFPKHKYAFGHCRNQFGDGGRFWGSNAYPEDNQARHCTATRFTTDWPAPGDTLHRIRWVLSEPFDKNNPPNALAVAIYADPARTQYLYTMGGFIWQEPTETEPGEWYSEMPLGQAPSTPQDCHYAILLGSAPLGGGMTMPADVEQQEGYHWDNNVSG